MPQLNVHDFPPQLIWLLITFVVLYFLMAKLALPKIGAAIDARADRSRGDLDRAATLKSEAEAAMAAYEKAIAEARAQGQAMTRETDARLAKQAADRQAAQGAELASRLKEAEGRIAASRNAAMGNLAAVAAETARLAAERVAGVAVAPAEAEAAAREALAARGKA